MRANTSLILQSESSWTTVTRTCPTTLTWRAWLWATEWWTSGTTHSINPKSSTWLNTILWMIVSIKSTRAAASKTSTPLDASTSGTSSNSIRKWWIHTVTMYSFRCLWSVQARQVLGSSQNDRSCPQIQEQQEENSRSLERCQHGFGELGRVKINCRMSKR